MDLSSKSDNFFNQTYNIGHICWNAVPFLPLLYPSFPFNVDLQDARVQKQLCQRNIGERGATLWREGMADTCCTFLS